MTVIGVKVDVKGKGETICRARLLFVVADLPAKASLLNIIQFNGKFGCPSCYHEGEQVSRMLFISLSHNLAHIKCLHVSPSMHLKSHRNFYLTSCTLENFIKSSMLQYEYATSS